MANLPRKPDFREKILQSLRIFREVLGLELQGNRMAQLEIVGPVNFPHATLADQRDNPIPLSDLCSRQEPSMMGV
jgi:hypothetical protein